MPKTKWKREPYSDRYRLMWGEWQIIAVGLGFDQSRSFYVVKRNGKAVEEFDRLSEAKDFVECDKAR